jgi:hypothetical protein
MAAVVAQPFLFNFTFPSKAVRNVTYIYIFAADGFSVSQEFAL